MSKIHEIRPSSWDHLKLHQILRDWRDKRVLVIGDVGVDRYVLGLVERISPEAPVPIVLVQEEQLKLGLAANVADNVQALEAEAVLVGVVGKDRSAQDFRVLLKGAGVSSGSLITDSSRRTVLKERVVSDRQQLLRVDYESQHGLEPRVEKQVLSKISELLRSCDVVLLEDYAKGFLSKSLASEIFRRARAAGKIVTVDPHPKSPLGNYRGAHVLTPNTKEAEALTGILIRDETTLCQAGQAMIRATGAKHVVITRGKEGMAIFTKGSARVTSIPTYAQEVYDVSGAGDTVIAVLSLALSAGASIDEAAVLGNLAAGVEVGKRGTATVSPQEIRVAMEFFGTMGV